MNPDDQHSDPPDDRQSGPDPRTRSWLDDYVDHRLAELGRELTDQAEPGQRGDPPTAPDITEPDLAPYLAELAERYRRGHG